MHELLMKDCSRFVIFIDGNRFLWSVERNSVEHKIKTATNLDGKRYYIMNRHPDVINSFPKKGFCTAQEPKDR